MLSSLILSNREDYDGPEQALRDGDGDGEQHIDGDMPVRQAIKRASAASLANDNSTVHLANLHCNLRCTEAYLKEQSGKRLKSIHTAEKASLAKFCKGCTHQLVFGCEVGVLPAVPPEDVKVSPLTPRTYTRYVFAPAPCACAPVCKNRHTGTSIFTATRNTFHERLSPNTPSKL